LLQHCTIAADTALTSRHGLLLLRTSCFAVFFDMKNPIEATAPAGRLADTVKT